MKLLLTSAGLTNKTINNELLKMLRKPFEESKIVFIPTAMHMEFGDKSWFIKNLNEIKNLNFKEIEIVDISAVPKNIWFPKLQNADVIFCEGGFNFHLARWVEKSGLKEVLPELLQDKIWVGASSGAMVLSPYQSTLISQEIYEEDLGERENFPSLGFVDFLFIPHLNSLDFTQIRKENLVKILKDFKEKVYILDDNSAISVIDREVKVVSQGDWFVLN
jgi:dipeptidase E